MKKCHCFFGGVLVCLFLFGSCSGGIDPGKNTPLEEESIEEKTKDTGKDDSEDKKKKDDTGDIEDPSEEIPLPAAFLSYKTMPENEIVFEFSDSVSFVSLNIDKGLGYEVIEKEGNEIIIKLTGNSDPGMSVKAELQVKDEHENPISKQVTFRTRNDRVPLLQINELRTEHDKDTFKAEFIEFKMLSDGNLGALRVYVVGNTNDPLLYEFAPVEVKEKDYVVLHLRTYKDSCRDEYGENLGESEGADSCPKARDFWIPGLNDLLHKTDTVYVLNQDGNVLDAIIFAENSDAWQGKNHFTEAAKFLFSKGAWKSPAGTVCTAAEAVNSSKTTTTRTICRDETVENTYNAANWYIVKTSGATPGEKNNTTPFN
jgi:hypothetical protein